MPSNPITTNRAIFILSVAGLFILLIVLPNQALELQSKVIQMNTMPNHNSVSNSPLQEQSLQAGVVAIHTQGGKQLSGINETLGPGGCAFDFNNDNRLDIFTVGGSGQTRYFGRKEWWQKERGNALFANIGNGQFKNVTQQSGLTEKFWGIGCTTADLDNDGDQDILLTNLGTNTLYRNNGDGTFTDITTSSGISGQQWSNTAAIADYDNDGLLDIYIVNYIDYDKGARTQEKGSGFLSQKPKFNPALYNSQPNRLYHNKGSLQFEDTTSTAGVADSGGRGLSAQWLDINNDFNIDLIVANDVGLPNVLYINNGNGTFAEESRRYNLNTSQSTRGISSGDIDNDGDTDLIMSTDNTTPLLAYIKGRSPAYPLERQLSETNIFNDLARDIGFVDERVTSMNGWGLSLQDFNNDGWLDLLTVNGYKTPDPDNHSIPQGQPKQIWINQGDGQFRACGLACGQVLHDSISARGIAVADFDNDGDIDSFISHNNDMGQLLYNQTNNQYWINLQLQGTKSNRDAIGTRVVITTQQGIQTRIVNGNPSFLSSGDKRLHFGLGKEKLIKNIDIFWPNGDKQSFSNIEATRFLRIIQGQEKLEETNHRLFQKKSQSRLIFTSLEQRLLSIDWLYKSGSDLAKNELRYLQQDQNSDVRKQLIGLAHRYQSPETLSILITALNDDNEENRLSAIQALKSYESEISVRWLLRSFGDTSVQVRCATAHTFGSFFREEEAVVIHKYLAVSYLIRMLNDEAASVRACAARALGDAERYRAAMPLTHLLNDDDLNVRAEAARALGHIREKIAVPFLLKTLDDPQQSGEVKLHSIVALQRLGYPNIYSLLRSLLDKATTDKNINQLNSLTHALSLLVTDREVGITFRSEEISALVYQWITNTPNTLKWKNNTLTYIHILEIFKNTRNLKTISFAKNMQASDHEDIRAHAYALLISLPHKDNQQYALKALLDKSNKVLSVTYQTLLKSSFKLPVRAITPLHSASDIRQLQIDLLLKYNNDHSHKYLVELATKNSNDVTIRKQVLEFLIASKSKKLFTLPYSVYQDIEPDIRALAIQYWMRQSAKTTFIKYMPEHLSNALKDIDMDVRLVASQALAKRKETWAVQKRNDILSDKTIELPIRQALLETIVEVNTQGAASKLIQISQLKNDPVRLTALEKLSAYPSNDSRKILQDILENNAESVDAKFVATLALLQMGYSDAETLLLTKIESSL